MNLSEYKALKLSRQRQNFIHREICLACLRPSLTCYCQKIKVVDINPQFVILIHPEEAKRPIATARMAHLTLKNSLLVNGIDFSLNKKINNILEDPSKKCVLLYPGKDSIDLSKSQELQQFSSSYDKNQLIIFVLDGTWRTVRKILHMSPRLQELPKISFTVNKLSNFRIRQQPKDFCFSTIEAIHETLALLDPCQKTYFHNLMDVFNHMVEQQISITKKYKNKNEKSRYRLNRDKRLGLHFI